MSNSVLVNIQAPATITANATGASVNIAGFTGNGRVTLHSSATGGADQTLNVAIYDSADGTTFAPTAVSFAQVTNSGPSLQDLFVPLDQFRQYVQAVATAGGTLPTVTYSVTMRGLKHQG